MLSLLTAIAAGALAQTTTIDWGETARSDIEFIHRETLEHHPGPLDAENPGFRAAMEAAREHGLALAAGVETQAGYAAALYAYAARYRDGHYGVRVQRGIDDYAWPGFIVTRVGGVWFAHAHREDVASIDGMQISACDGRHLDDWMSERVFAFYGNPALGADWGRRAPQVLLDRRNPFIARPVRCDFSNAETQMSLALAWQDIAIDPWWDMADAESRPEPAPWGLREFSANSYWIGMPTFGPQGEDLAAMEALLDDLEANAEILRTADRLVFDVRGNSGGSSAWGDEVIARIWGEAYAEYRAPRGSSGVDFRISDDNLEHVRWIIRQTVEQDLADAEIYFREVLAGMLAAQEAGENFYREVAEPELPAPVAIDRVEGQVYFLTDGACGSACLDFADRMYALGGVTHIGGETVADSDYMELRTVEFPSGHGSLGLPIKVYRGRPRASGQSYVPEMAYPGTDWSTAALEAWVMGLED